MRSESALGDEANLLNGLREWPALVAQIRTWSDGEIQMMNLASQVKSRSVGES